MKQYWLMKSEPTEVSIDDLMAAPGHTMPWFGVRNYQARNFMRDGMRKATACCSTIPAAPPGVAGVAEVASTAYPDHSRSIKTAIISTRKPPGKPRWISVDVRGLKKTALLPLLRCAGCRRWKT